MEVKNAEIQLLYGGATHSFFEMTEAEAQEAAKEIKKRAAEKAFSRGLPIYYSKKGVLVAEFIDGRRFVVENSKLTVPYVEN